MLASIPLKAIHEELKDWEGVVKDLHQACEDRDQDAYRAMLENEKQRSMNEAEAIVEKVGVHSTCLQTNCNGY